jgi:hypothetical protein
VELSTDHRAVDAAEGAGHRRVDRLDGHLLEHLPGDVLGPERLPDLRVVRHDHRGRAVAPRQPAVGRERDDAAAVVVGDVLAEVPDRPVVGLGVVVEGHLLDPVVEKGCVLGDERLDALAGRPFDEPRVGQQRGLRVERPTVDPAVEHGRAEPGDREEGVRHVRRVRERWGHEVHARIVRSRREVGQPGGRHLLIGGLGDEDGP